MRVSLGDKKQLETAGIQILELLFSASVFLVTAPTLEWWRPPWPTLGPAVRSLVTEHLEQGLALTS